MRKILNKYSKTGTKLFTTGLLFGGMCWLGACNKDFSNRINGSRDDSTGISDLPSQKVLFIMMDGTRGTVLQTINPTNLASLGENAIYAYNSVNNKTNVNAAGWADLLTGVWGAKHKVTTDDFAGNNLAAYPSLLTRLKTLRPESRTAAFTTSTVLNNNLLQDATTKAAYSNDKEVKNAVITELSTQNAQVVVAEFGSIDKAGVAAGYTATTQPYIDSIRNVDAYIGEIMTALRDRETFDKENWLVVVASNKGGPATLGAGENDNTDFSEPKANGFVYFYNPRFVSKYIPKPNTAAISFKAFGAPFSASLYSGIPTTTANIYNVGTTTEMTVSVKVKVTKFGTLNPGILFKSSSTANLAVGWWLIHSGSDGTWRFVLRTSSVTTTVTNGTVDAPKMQLNRWYDLCAKIYFSGTKRLLQIYQNGIPILAAPVDVTGRDCTNAIDLGVGFKGNYGTGASQILSDIRLFNVAVPDDVIRQYACKPGIDETHPYYDKLIGYWPANEGLGNRFIDKSPSARDFVHASASPTWSAFDDLDANICPPLPGTLLLQVPRSVDVPFMIYNWLNVQPTNWSLDGKGWITSYTDI